MDATRFDRLARALGGATSRRGALAALSGLLAAGLAGDGMAKRRRCRKDSPPGQCCRKNGACACLDGGVACGAQCCVDGERCRDGQCRQIHACIEPGNPCKAAGRPCCGDRACASGQGGKDDVACYVPAGGACAETSECVYGSACTGGVCVVVDPTPSPTPVPCCTFVPTGDPAADGETLRRLAADPSGPDPILLCPGVYRAAGTVLIDRDLEIAACDPAGGEVTLDGGWPGGSATEGRRVLAVGSTAADPIRVRIAGIAVRNGQAGAEFGGCLTNGAASSLALTDVVVSGCAAKAGGCIHNLGTLDMVRGSVSGGRAEEGGGITNFPGATLTITDGVVEECQAAGGNGAGGGISNSSSASATLTDTAIRRCTALQGLSVLGGGILNAGTLAIQGGEISGCQALGDGGGIYNNTGTVTIAGCRITGCSAGIYGSGGAIFNLAALTLGSGTVISGNSAGVLAPGVMSTVGTTTCTPAPPAVDAPSVCANPTDGAAGCLGASLGAGNCAGVCQGSC